METADSIRQYGCTGPGHCPPGPERGYELVAGHRRHRASELAGKDTMPVIVRDLDDDQATISWLTATYSGKPAPQREGFCLQDEVGSHQAPGARTDFNFCSS